MHAMQPFMHVRGACICFHRTSRRIRLVLLGNEPHSSLQMVRRTDTPLEGYTWFPAGLKSGSNCAGAAFGAPMTQASHDETADLHMVTAAVRTAECAMRECGTGAQGEGVAHVAPAGNTW